MKEEKEKLFVRCPLDLLAKTDEYADYMHMTRSAFIVEAIRMFLDQVNERGGFIVPPYTSKKKL